MSAYVNNGIYIGGNAGNNSAYIVGSTDVNVNISNQMQESQATLDTEFEKLIKDFQLSNQQISELRDNLNEFKAYMESQSSRKSTAKILLNNVKGLLGAMISNTDAIEKFIGLGQKMIDLWK